MLWPALKELHDSVLVVTADGFDDRHESVTRELGADNFEFVYGVNKASTSMEELIERGIYDEQRAIKLDRRGKPMTIGAICCSIGHRMAYERFLKTDGRRCLILEDDVRMGEYSDDHVSRVVRDSPPDADLIYWGYSLGGRRPPGGVLKQAFYHVIHSLGILKYDHTMIRNLYDQPYNEHFDIAGKHLLSHAFTISRHGAEQLIKWNTPIALNADTNMLYAVTTNDVRGYAAREQIIGQRSIDPSDAMITRQ